ncbi:MAG: FkbM family methyltransferase [Candidatus Omnitrophica bacterium]|nr:FkbM family methyltransferase [Candidatus Omnitrophota bacterium]
MSRHVDPAAIGSDVARSRSQYLARLLARVVVNLLGLNRTGAVATEIVQAIQPVAKIQTRHGVFVCKGGHGRLLWRARTFHTEEPQTIAWLDALQPEDVLWDVGANVGLYAIYAAKFFRCQVIAIEPESQNYALLVENIALNEVGNRCFPACLALGNRAGLGRLRVRYLTKGGAYNWFVLGEGRRGREEKAVLPASIATAWGVQQQGAVEQVIYGASIDELVHACGLPPPTHLKIDVDGLEPEIIEGAPQVLRQSTLRSLLVEINQRSTTDVRIPDILAGYGFRLVSERSNWLSRTDRTREAEAPATNMIFTRDGQGPGRLDGEARPPHQSAIRRDVRESSLSVRREEGAARI